MQHLHWGRFLDHFLSVSTSHFQHSSSVSFLTMSCSNIFLPFFSSTSPHTASAQGQPSGDCYFCGCRTTSRYKDTLVVVTVLQTHIINRVVRIVRMHTPNRPSLATKTLLNAFNCIYKTFHLDNAHRTSMKQPVVTYRRYRQMTEASLTTGPVYHENGHYSIGVIRESRITCRSRKDTKVHEIREDGNV